MLKWAYLRALSELVSQMGIRKCLWKLNNSIEDAYEVARALLHLGIVWIFFSFTDFFFLQIGKSTTQIQGAGHMGRSSTAAADHASGLHHGSSEDVPGAVASAALCLCASIIIWSAKIGSTSFLSC